jgi:hypothetical protein
VATKAMPAIATAANMLNECRFNVVPPGHRSPTGGALPPPQ